MAFGDLEQRNESFSNLTHPFNVAYDNNVVAGNLLLCYTSAPADETPSITDSRSNTWTLAVEVVDAPVANIVWGLYYAVANSSGACTVTVASSPGNGSAVTYIFEYEGPFGGGALVDTAGAQGVSAASSTGAMTSTRNGQLFVAGHLTADAGEENGGWVEDVDELGGGVAYLVFSHLVLGTAGNETGDVSLPANYWINVGAVFGPKLLATAEAGAYSLTGTAAALRATRIFPAEGGAYTITGTAATLAHGTFITAEGGSYALTGTAAELRATRIFSAEGGSYALTGTAAALIATRIFSAEGGSYAIDGDAGGGTTLTKGDASGGGSSYHYNRKRRR